MAIPRICSIPNCGKAAQKRGWCEAHYTRWLRHGDPLGGRMPIKTCTIPNCGKAVFSRGWCRSHYDRWRRNGDPLAGNTSRGEASRFFEDVVLVYEGDDCLIWPFGRFRTGYGQLAHQGVHRLVCERVNGSPPTPRHHAAHSCGKGHIGCVSPKHLSWKTPSANLADRVSHGTHVRGIQNPNSKLRIGQVRDIRRLKGAVTQQEAADHFGVGKTTIGKIWRGQSWTSIP